MTDNVKDTENGTQETKADNDKPKAPSKKEAKEVLTRQEKAEINKRALASRQEKNDMIAMQKTNALDPIAYEQLKMVAQDYIDSGAVPKGFANVIQVLRVLQAAQTLGISAEDALGGMYFVNGMLNIYGKLTPTVLANAGYKWDFYDEDGDFTKVTVKIWKGGSKFDVDSEKMIPDPDNVTEFYSDTFDVSDAKKSGYGGGVGFKDGKNRQRKLRYEVLSLVIHTRVPHVLNGVAGIAEVSERYQAEIDETGRNSDDKMKAKISKAVGEDVVEGEVLDNDFKPKPISNEA